MEFFYFVSNELGYRKRQKVLFWHKKIFFIYGTVECRSHFKRPSVTEWHIQFTSVPFKFIPEKH